MSDATDLSPTVLAALRPICLALPEAYEEQAWVGTRWMVRKKTFAHVLLVAGGWPPAYAKAAGSDGPATLLMFRSSGAEAHALRRMGPPFFAPVWRADEVGMILNATLDWDEVTELLTESYCLLAPRSLAARVERPGP